MNLFIHLRIGVGGGGILPQLKKYQKLRQRDESQFIHEHLTLMDITYYSYLVECANRMKAYIYIPITHRYSGGMVALWATGVGFKHQKSTGKLLAFLIIPSDVLCCDTDTFVIFCYV